MQRAGCNFRVLRKTGQRPPISEVKRLKMVGRGQTILPKDEEEIGLEARRFLRHQPCHFVILIDDVEYARRPVLEQVFHRYRAVLDTMLLPEEKLRAAVHFFANMLEAYYFADSQAVNQSLGVIILAADASGDVEEIRHPKGELKRLHPGFDEKADGAKIVSALDLDRVLDTAETCAFLRSLFGWCVRQLKRHCPVHDPALHTRYQLPMGSSQAELTRGQ
jgi:hypothetical protein